MAESPDTAPVPAPDSRRRSQYSLPGTQPTSRATQQAPLTTHHSPVSTFGFVCAVAVVTAVSFYPALQNGFVSWDDPGLILENPRIRSLGRDSLQWMFTSFHMGPYQPLSWLSWAVDYAIWGLNPFGFHLTSLLLHVASAVSLYLVARRLLALAQPSSISHPLLLQGSAALSALLFAVHPLRVESVVWASERRDVLAGLFVLWSVAAYLRALESERAGRRRTGWLVVSLLLFAASLLSKATAIGLPLLLSVLDVYPLRRLGATAREWLGARARRIWLEKLPYWTLSLAAAAAALHGQHEVRAFVSLTQYGPIDRLAVAAFATMFYLWKTIVPVGLSPLYQLPAQANPLEVRFIVAAAGVLAITGVIVRWRRQVPALLTAWLCYLVMLAPVSGLTQVGSQIAADRYTYLSCVAFAVWAGGAVLCALVARESMGRWSGPLMASLLVACPAVLGTLSWRQSRIWHDSESLWRYAVAVDPQSSTALTGLGRALADAGNLDAGREWLEKAVATGPTNAIAHNNLADVLRQLRQPEPAREHYLIAWRLLPQAPDISYNLGLWHEEQEDLQAAAEWYERSLAIWPDFLKPVRRLAQVYSALGHLGRAIALYERAVRLDPDDAAAHNDLATLLRRTGAARSALDHYAAALRLTPNSADIAYNIGLLFQEQGQWQNAEQWYERSLAFRPDSARTLSNLGIVNKRLGRIDRAIELYKQAAAIDPASVDSRYNLGIALSEQATEDADEAAAEQYRRVLEIEPAHAGASNNLALIFERRGRFGEAAEVLRPAVERAPDHAVLLYHLSWLLATAPEADARQAQEAVTLAERLNQNTGHTQPQALDALAAAYAANGQFDKAAETAERAAQLAAQAGQPGLAQKIEQRRVRYHAGERWNSPP